MADVKKKYNVTAQGVLDIEEDEVYLETENLGSIALSKVLEDFNGRPIKISVNYEEEYSDSEVDEETGELI